VTRTRALMQAVLLSAVWPQCGIIQILRFDFPC